MLLKDENAKIFNLSFTGFEILALLSFKNIPSYKISNL